MGYPITQSRGPTSELDPQSTQTGRRQARRRNCMKRTTLKLAIRNSQPLAVGLLLLMGLGALVRPAIPMAIHTVNSAQVKPTATPGKGSSQFKAGGPVSINRLKSLPATGSALAFS